MKRLGDARALLAGWLPAIAPAIGLMLVLATSCVLPSYSVGGSTSGGAAGGSTSTGSPMGGAGGVGQSSSGTVSVGPGGAGLGGSGIGGDIHTCGASTAGLERVAIADTPHGVTLSTKYVYWIADPENDVYAALRTPPYTQTAFAIADICGIAGSPVQGEDKVVMRATDGRIYVAAPGSAPTSAFGPAGGSLTGGACAISVSPNGDDVYGFDVDQKGVYSVVKYSLSKPNMPTTFLSAMGTPIAIDASDTDDVGWVEAIDGAGAFFAYTKATRAMDYTQGGGWTDVCAYGTSMFAFTDPSTKIIDTWSQVPGAGVFALNTPASWIACNSSFRAWIEYGDGCATLKHQKKAFGTPKLIAKNQPRACSIAVGASSVFWTNCEPSGGVFKAPLP